MDNYFEQSVPARRGPREQLLYSLCWVGIVVFGAVAILSASGIASIEADSLGINWGAIGILAVAAAAAVLLYSQKDKVYVEYDYILWNSELEVWAVYNRQRRKKVGTIHLNRVTAWGPASALANRMRDMKPNRWCPCEEAAWALIYSDEGGNGAALLELGAEMCAQLRASGSAMRSSEVRA